MDSICIERSRVIVMSNNNLLSNKPELNSCKPSSNNQMAQSILDHVREVVTLLVLVIYHWLVAIVRAILPASIQGKDISGETVLITGAGRYRKPQV